MKSDKKNEEFLIAILSQLRRPFFISPRDSRRRRILSFHELKIFSLFSITDPRNLRRCIRQCCLVGLRLKLNHIIAFLWMATAVATSPGLNRLHRHHEDLAACCHPLIMAIDSFIKRKMTKVTFNMTFSLNLGNFTFTQNADVFLPSFHLFHSVHGSQISLMSGGSSMYGSTTEEQRQITEMRRLKRELTEAREQVMSLSSQLSTNVSREFHY